MRSPTDGRNLAVTMVFVGRPSLCSSFSNLPISPPSCSRGLFDTLREGSCTGLLILAPDARQFAEEDFRKNEKRSTWFRNENVRKINPIKRTREKEMKVFSSDQPKDETNNSNNAARPRRGVKSLMSEMGKCVAEEWDEVVGLAPDLRAVVAKFQYIPTPTGQE
jgi:hypothetical protein